jgi:hypothetical protein
MTIMQELEEELDYKKYKDLYKLDISSKTVNFNIRVKDEYTGQSYSGDFEMKLFLNLGERSVKAREATRRNLDIDPFDQIFRFNSIICELKVHCLNCPDWFKNEEPFNMVGIQPIEQIFILLSAAQKEYKERVVNV